MNPSRFIHVLSLDTIGGVEALYTHYITHALSVSNHSHYTCVSGKLPHKQIAKQFARSKHTPFLEEYVLKMRFPRLLRSFVQFRRTLLETRVAPSAWVFWNRIEAKRPPGMSIYYEHGAAWNEQPTKAKESFLKSHQCICANSQAAGTILKKKWGISLPITVIPNPLRPDISIKSHARSAPHSQPIILGFIGRLVPVKGVGVALHTLKILRDRNIDVRLKIVGTGPDKISLQRQASCLNIESAIEWIDHLSDVSSFYDTIDLLLLPSVREPLGLVSLEAAARGVPVIATAIDGIPEAVLDKKTGICVHPTLHLFEAKEMMTSLHLMPSSVVNPMTQELIAPKVVDPTLYADAICASLHTPGLYETMSINALEHAQSRAEFGRYYQQIQALLGETVISSGNQ